VITLLVDPDRLAADEPLQIAGEAFRHHFRARRAAVGERLRLVDGHGGARWGEVLRVERDAAWVRPGGTAPAQDPELRLELLVAPPRPERAAWLVEKAAELGVGAVRFVESERGPRDYGAATLVRLRRVAAAALEQAQGARLLEVTGVHGRDELAALASPFPARWALDVEGGVAPAPPPREGAILAVGPEGGWSDAERERLAALGFAPLSLGPRTLRVETAAVVGAGALLAAAGAATKRNSRLG
jgi:16S rRNA (uracil1498-N3)-methyltransferase